MSQTNGINQERDSKSRKITVYLTQAQHNAVTTAAKQDDRSLSHTVRNCVIEQFGSLQVNVINQDGDVWLTAEQIGQALEYKKPRQTVMNIHRRNQNELSKHTALFNLVIQNKNGEHQTRLMRVFNEEGVMLICMWSKQPKAREFRKWAIAVIKKHCQGQTKKHISDMQQRALTQESTH